MSLLHLHQSINATHASIDPSSFSSSTFIPIFALNPSSKLDKKYGFWNSRCVDGLRLQTPLLVKRWNSVFCNASSDAEGSGSDAYYALSESEDDYTEGFPLDSKLQLKLERNMRMKFSKKIRMRRKKLGRKRLLRKKGTLSPSKLKKKMHDPVPKLGLQASCAKLSEVVAAVTPGSETKTRELRGITKPCPVSLEMQALVHVPEIARTQAIKLIWTYIKENNLQDSENKKIIICDDKLKKIFKGNERVGILEVGGLISPHFL